MGACVAKAQPNERTKRNGAKGKNDSIGQLGVEEDSASESTVDVLYDASDPQDASLSSDKKLDLPNGHDSVISTVTKNDLEDNTENDANEKMIGNGLTNDSFSKRTPFKLSSFDTREQSELRQSAEFWDTEDRIYSLPSEALVEHYHKDAQLILKSLDRIEQAFHANNDFRPSSPIEKDGLQSLERASVSLRGNPDFSAGEVLKASTLQHQLSEAVSICDERGLVPGLPNKSLRVLLSADPLFVGARQDYEDGRMLKARKKLRSWSKRHGLKFQELETYSLELGVDVAEIQAHCKIIEQAVESHRNEDGYSIARDDGELRVLYKTANKGKYHCVKMEATLPFPLERPLSLAREFDLMKTWNKYISESERLFAPTIWESYVYAGLWMPFPFPQMECLGKGRGYDLSEDFARRATRYIYFCLQEYRCLMIACESVEEKDLPEGSLPIPKAKKKHHRAEVIPGSSIRLEPLPPLPGDSARTKGSIVMIIDAHVPHVPSFIVNWVLGVMAPFAHRQIKKLLRDDYDSPEKPFPKRMAQHPELYDKVRKSVKVGLEKHYGAQNTSLT